MESANIQRYPNLKWGYIWRIPVSHCLSLWKLEIGTQALRTHIGLSQFCKGWPSQIAIYENNITHYVIYVIIYVICYNIIYNKIYAKYNNAEHQHNPPKRSYKYKMVCLKYKLPLCVCSFTDLRSLVFFRTLMQVMTSAATTPIPTHDTQMTGSTGKVSLKNTLIVISFGGGFCSALFRAWMSPAKSHQTAQCYLCSSS